MCVIVAGETGNWKMCEMCISASVITKRDHQTDNAEMAQNTINMFPTAAMRFVAVFLDHLL